MNHSALAALRERLSGARVGFQLSSNLPLDEALHALAGVGIGVLGMGLYMNRCRRGMFDWAIESSKEQAKIAADTSKGELWAAQASGRALAFAQCAKKISAK